MTLVVELVPRWRHIDGTEPRTVARSGPRVTTRRLTIRVCECPARMTVVVVSIDRRDWHQLALGAVSGVSRPVRFFTN